jgi:hypothetical protein
MECRCIRLNPAPNAAGIHRKDRARPASQPHARTPTDIVDTTARPKGSPRQSSDVP